MIKRQSILKIVLLILVTVVAACATPKPPETSAPPVSATDVPISPTEAPALPTNTPETNTPEPSPEPVEPLSQWAIDAAASSQYGDDNWSTKQATGEPNTPECGDIETAWASRSSSNIDLLDVYYETAVYATTINIHQSYNPDQVVQVDLIDLKGEIIPIHTQEQSNKVEECPYVLEISVDQTDFLVQGVRITVDQSFLNSWNEIDAVELIGIPGEGAATRPAPPEAPAITFDTPAGFLWRNGGKDDYAFFGGMDVSADGLVYVTDNIHGVWIYDTEGNQVGVIDHADFNNPKDVKIGPDGNLYVASWGADQVFVLSPEGVLLNQFGEEGTGDGQFGTFSPSELAVGPDGVVYVLDENEDADGENYVRIQKFTSDGTFIEWFPIEEDFFAASGLDIGPDGNLYVVGFVGGYIIKMDTDGNILEKLGEDAIDFAGPQQIALDAEGNMYVSIWTDAGAVKLDPAGNLIARFGVEVDPGDRDWPGGGFRSPQGVAVLPDGSMTFISDGSGTYSYVTAFTFNAE